MGARVGYQGGEEEQEEARRCAHWDAVEREERQVFGKEGGGGGVEGWERGICILCFMRHV